MDDTLREQVRDKLFEARMSRIYHERRQQAFHFWARLLSFISGFGATAVFFSIQNTGAVYLGVSAVNLAAASAAVLGVAQFVSFFAGFERVSYNHETLRAGFLAQELEAVKLLTDTSSREDVIKFLERARVLEGSEGPTVALLVNRAFNEQYLAQLPAGRKPDISKLQNGGGIFGWIRSSLPF